MWTSVNKIILYGVLFNSLRMLVGAISAIYFTTIGFSFMEITYIKTFQIFVILTLDIPLSYITDKNSKKLSIILSAIFAILWLLIMGLGHEKYHFYIAEFLNAISISLMSGAFIAYLISNRDSNNKSETIQIILGKYSQYQFLFMGIASLVASFFINVDSKTIWIVSAFLISIQVITLSWILPKDTKTYSSTKPSFSSDIIKILFDILSNINIKWYFYFIILLSIFYKTIIQFWQLIVNDNSHINENAIYFGIIFSLILFAQSISGYIAHKYKPKNNYIVVVIVMLIIFLILLISVFNMDKFIFLPAMIIYMFMVNKLMLIIITSKIHENINDDLRATYDSVISVFIRILLFGTFPLIGFLYTFIGLHLIVILFVISCIPYFMFLNKK